MNENKRELAALIRAHMELHNIDQKAMAAEFGVSEATLSMWLKVDGGHGMTHKNAEKIRFICRDAKKPEAVEEIPTDLYLQEIFRCWKLLTAAERAEVAGHASRLVEEKSKAGDALA